jgi:hypothetical protein
MDIISPSVSPKIINNAVTLAAIANVLVAAIPGIQVGYLKRLAVSNPTGALATLMVQDKYSLDSSAGLPVPPATTTKDRYPLIVPAGKMVDINGHTISKHMGSLQITSDVAGVIASYVLQLE